MSGRGGDGKGDTNHKCTWCSSKVGNSEQSSLKPQTKVVAVAAVAAAVVITTVSTVLQGVN